MIGRAIITARGRHGIIPYYRSNVQILGKHLICRDQFHNQGAPQGNPLLSPLKHCFTVILSPEGATGQVCRRFWLVESSFTTRGRHVSSLLSPMMGREPSRDLWRHSSSFAYHVTSLWRSPSCFAAMLFCDDKLTRRRCYNVTVPHLYITWPLYGGCHLVLLPCCFALIRLPDGAVGQGRRSKVTALWYLFICQLGLGLVTLILSSVVTKRNTIPHFHPASRLKPSGRMFVHTAGKT